jgi:hypothetical protein
LPRKALLLGLDDYEDTGPHDIGLKLDAPRNDVALVAETLRFLGFDPKTSFHAYPVDARRSQRTICADKFKRLSAKTHDRMTSC